VLDAAAIGVPDAEWGERVHSFVSFKRPRAIDILPALPKNSVGKIAKSELREPFWKESGRSV
jgi:acyl-CoA synthetase (AMP-forming)/AMP-acid ligase II